MPIRKENLGRYPKDWPKISGQIKDRAGHKCEECGVPNYEKGGRALDGTWHKALPLGEKLGRLEWPHEGDFAWCEGYTVTQLRIVRIVLTVGHLDHTPEHCDPENLKAWCQRCHNRYDAKERRAGTQRRQRAKNLDLFE